MGTAVRRADERPENQECTASRNDVLARYRRLREIGKLHHSKGFDFLSRDAVLQQARRLGLATGRTLLIDSEEELTLAFDLAIYTAPAGRTRAIERYARSAQFPASSDEALMLAAMRDARFALIMVQERHPAAGLIVTDVVRQSDLWLMDEGFEQSLPDGAVVATRYYKPGDFAMTAGVSIPVDLDFLHAVLLTVPQLGGLPLVEVLEDRRFAEALYRTAIGTAVMEQIAYRDPGDGTAAPR